jgi:hypothetical protein
MKKHGEVTAPRRSSPSKERRTSIRRTASNGVQMSNLPKRASKNKVIHAVKDSRASPIPEAPAFMPREEVTSFNCTALASLKQYDMEECKGFL